jgi:hypothetical protein
VYLDSLHVLLEPRDDELHLARDVMQRLYEHAGRKLPDFFPTRPLEEIHDPGAARWRDLIHRRRQAVLRRERDRLTIEFTDDLQHHEIKPYLGLLPQTLRCEQSGRKLIVENRPSSIGGWAMPGLLSSNARAASSGDRRDTQRAGVMTAVALRRGILVHAAKFHRGQGSGRPQRRLS